MGIAAGASPLGIAIVAIWSSPFGRDYVADNLLGIAEKESNLADTLRREG